MLRQVYGDAFHLIGVYTPLRVRSAFLRNEHLMEPEDAERLLSRDAGEELDLGQQVTKTYHLSDLFIQALGWDDASVASATEQFGRYLDLLFGRRIVTPTVDEHGMFLANSAALRSADLSRQVGAAILTQGGEAIALGANEVPKAGGGQYWEADATADRDVEREEDSNEVIRLECLAEVLGMLVPDWHDLGEDDREERIAAASNELASTRLMNLTEFGRAVHAEMEAILSAARVGVSLSGSRLYTTTLPCHNCAKHIVGAGISQVVYVEPYSKSLADRLHKDAIAFSLDEESGSETKIPFSSFTGVAPRRYRRLFSTVEPDGTRVKRKESGGRLRRNPVGLRMAATPLTHVDREALVARYLEEQIASLGGESDDEAGEEEQ